MKNKTMYAITHINKDGDRILTFANQGRNHFATKEQALDRLKCINESGDLKAKILGNMADTLEVHPIECYHHGDALGIYIN